MRKKLIFAIAGSAVLAGTVAQAQVGGGLRERLRERFAERAQQAEAGAPDVASGETIAYGEDSLQTLDFWPAQGVAKDAPLIVFVHGGGWQRGSKDNATGRWKPSHYPAAGYAFASIDYRLVPDATVEKQGADVAHAVRALVDRAGELGIDPHRIVLMGHSAGAHLVALVGTDESYLKAAGLSFANIAGVVPIDGAAYDVPTQMRDGPRMMQATYEQAFGIDPKRERELSPTFHAAAPNAPRFLLLHVQRPDGISQAQALAEALRKGGSAVEVGSFPGEGLPGHMEINRRLGDPDYAATATVDAWLKRVFAS